MSGTGKDAEAAPDETPDPKALEAIGRALEVHYSDLVQAPLPERFVELLARLEVGDGALRRHGSGDANG